MTTTKTTLLCAALALSPSVASAAPPTASRCQSPAQTDCFFGEVFVLDGGRPNAGAADGSRLLGDKNAVGRSTPDVAPGADAAATLLEALRDKGLALPATDEVVLFTSDFNAPGWDLTFYRDGAANRVEGLGLPVVPPTRPFVGWITAGSTAAYPDDVSKPDKMACPEKSACTPTFYTPFGALAQATANVYGPHLAGVSVTKLGDKVHPTWNALFDFRGSLLGGNYWRDNGNGVYETSAGVPPLVGVGGALEGKGFLRFEPLDLYLLGFYAYEDLVALPKVAHFTKATPAKLLKPAMATAFGKDAGPEMGRKAGVQLPESERATMGFDALVGSERRSPGFANAPHFLRQQWALVTSPTQDEKTRTAAVEKVERLRKAWSSYFYAMADHRGRVLTSFEAGVDDTADFQFAQPAEEGAGGAYGYQGFDAVELLRASVTAGLDASESFVRLATPGASGSVTLRAWKGARLAVGGGVNAPNAVLIRLRTRAVRARARLAVPGGASLTIPNSADAYLLGDGRWHTYAVPLEDRLPLDEADALVFTPSDVAATVDVDFVRLVHTPRAIESDEACGGAPNKKVAKPDGFLDEHDNCPKIPNPDQQDLDGNGVGDACEDFDGDSIVNACDNCLTINNFRQQDSNRDGQGDLCDDEGTGRGCYLDPYSVAGSTGGGGLVLLLGAAAVLSLSRRRRTTPPGARRRPAPRHVRRLP